jgi:hypothetical protein
MEQKTKGNTREPDSARPALGTVGKVARLGLIGVLMISAVGAYEHPYLTAN